MGQTLSPEDTARQLRRWGQFKVISLGLFASAFAMACSFGEIDGANGDDGFTPDPAATTDDNTPPPAVTGDQTAPPPASTGPSGGSTAPGASAPRDMLEAQAIGILQLNCSSCHGSANYANINYITNRDSLVANGKILEGDGANSPIYLRMSTNQMPPIGIIDQRPSAGDVEVIKLWIDNMKEIKPCSNNGEFVDFDTMYTSMLQDIQGEDAADRRFIRYIGVANAFNAGACGQDLEREQFALLKIIQSLSTNASITVPTPIDSRGLIYRIDIRDYNWDRAVAVKEGFSKVIGVNVVDENAVATPFTDLWEAVVATSAPYNVEFTGNEADQLKAQAQTNVPFLQSDAFIEASSTGNLYYAFIDVADTFTAFEAQLGVDEADQIAERRVLQAGFETSGVSKQERIVARYELNNVQGGALWVSYDFADNGLQNQSIYSDPLGRAQAGGEMIFNLPNGLQGYYVAANNAAQNRLTEAPLDVVVDPSQVKNLGAVTNGISCNGCHQKGIIQFTDTVRDWVLDDPTSYNQATFEAVTELYPDNKTMLAQVGSDKEVFQRALKASGVPLEIADPSTRVFLDFEVAPVKLARAAGDLGVTPDRLEKELARLDPRLRGVTVDGIDRELFKVVYLDSICQLQVSSENHPLEANCP